jgi:hypothetical protein
MRVFGNNSLDEGYCHYGLSAVDHERRFETSGRSCHLGCAPQAEAKLTQ